MWRSPKIIVVDDEIRICESLAYLLKSKDYEVTTAACGQDALVRVGENAFDLAVLDIHLPDIIGTDLIEKIKARNPDISVIVITGDANLDSALASLRCGAYDYLRKPFEFEEFLRTVENALNQKALKREKDKINHELYRSEEKYRYLVQNSPDIIYTLDADGNFTFLSEALEHLLGFTVDGLIGKHYSTIVCEEDRDKAQWFFDERRSGDRAASGIELRLKAVGDVQQNESVRRHLTVELKSMGIYEKSAIDGERRHVGTHGVIRDISERQRLYAQLQNAERMESLGTLAGGIAHDFNNLLMGIQGRSSLISMDMEDSHPVLEHLHAIEDYILSATHLTKQLLGFARGGKYEVKPTNINELVLKSANMFGRTKKEIIIETQFHNANIVVEADRRQIEQVLLNLYVNAWQAMPEGGTLRLETKHVVLGNKDCRPHQIEPGRYAHLSVTDTGIGMDQKTLQHIYDPFFTTKEKSRGTGLGLASAYGIIKNHAGIIHADSNVDHGTTFNLYLPISEKLVVKEASSEKNISNGSETILIVDDEDMIIDVGQALLKRMGYQVITAKSGEEALEVVHRIGPSIDLVILDMIMPGMDGGRTFDGIRETCPEIPIMLASGYAINGQAQKIMNRGCNGFIQKPFSVSELSQKVRQVLDTTGGLR
ncbi:response regulator [Desulfosarcina sp.]|uniref:hybrid sensor histidine kinase/response regulator n=1 Tax=Desulfosarcina sp. TaxID=2027861 RepID=UPI0029B5E289|nr:response regulator [Desulfosarcina sp.]MDX2451234.1 response regulator [Desulfosarcina sp.]MDX2489064.1 response regulator [Desulfosarcina sp.]